MFPGHRCRIGMEVVLVRAAEGPPLEGVGLIRRRLQLGGRSEERREHVVGAGAAPAENGSGIFAVQDDA